GVAGGGGGSEGEGGDGGVEPAPPGVPAAAASAPRAADRLVAVQCRVTDVAARLRVGQPAEADAAAAGVAALSARPARATDCQVEAQPTVAHFRCANRGVNTSAQS